MKQKYFRTFGWTGLSYIWEYRKFALVRQTGNDVVHYLLKDFEQGDLEKLMKSSLASNKDLLFETIEGQKITERNEVI